MKDICKNGFSEFDIEGNENKERRPVVLADTEELLEPVIEWRQFVGNYEVKIMADGEKGFFQICMFVRPENECPKQVNIENDPEESNNDLTKKKKVILWRGNCQQKSKVDQCTENYNGMHSCQDQRVI